MIERRHWQNRGAPLRTFFFVIAIWVLGRMVWESNFPVQSRPHNLATIEDVISFSAAKNAEIAIPFGNLTASDRSVNNSDPVFVNIPRSTPSIWNKNTFRQFRLILGLRNIESKTSALEDGLLSNHVTGFTLSEPKSYAMLGPDKHSPTPTINLSENRAPNETLDTQGGKKWSGYLWTFARQGSSESVASPAITSIQSTGGQYGGSQAGAILALKISGSERRGLSLFSRVSSSLSEGGEEELAIGAFIKPLKTLPLAIHAEQRLGRKGGLNRGTALYATGGSGPDELVNGVLLETYGQAGFVIGPRSSYFFDGSATMQKELFSRGRKRLTTGGGVWAGGQKNISRLDVGPRLNLDLPIGGTPTRISVDWRQRIAGNAQPNSGLAVTLSAGF